VNNENEIITPVSFEKPKPSALPALSGLSLEELEGFVKELGLPKFRAKQIHSWIYTKWVGSFDEMTDLGQDLREKLKASARVGMPIYKSAATTLANIYFNCKTEKSLNQSSWHFKTATH
jgi:adenine C2-methylase RlmN of 23S rRNA A2503 and tRNA A37